MMTAYRAGSRACSWLNFFFFFRAKNWASYEALSEQRGIEPATWHRASNEEMVNPYCTGPMDFPMQPLQFQQIKLLMNSGTIWDKIEDCQSIHMYTYITRNRIIMVNRKQHWFFWGRRVPLSWREIGKRNFRTMIWQATWPGHETGNSKEEGKKGRKHNTKRIQKGKGKEKTDGRRAKHGPKDARTHTHTHGKRFSQLNLEQL